MSHQLSATKIRTPVGLLWVVAINETIWGAELEPRWVTLALRLARKGWEIEPGAVRNRAQPILTRAAAALAKYFAGHLDALAKVPIALEGSELHRTVWKRVRKVRPGQTMTYAQLAEAVGKPGAFRAIGAANAANPCALFVPDHRIVASDGGLRGYGAGVDSKAWLLTHEGVRY
jgi:O-6-methylguanine DNA methyltransferase